MKQEYSRSKLKPRRVVVDPLNGQFLQDQEDKGAKLGKSQELRVFVAKVGLSKPTQQVAEVHLRVDLSDLWCMRHCHTGIQAAKFFVSLTQQTKIQPLCRLTSRRRGGNMWIPWGNFVCRTDKCILGQQWARCFNFFPSWCCQVGFYVLAAAINRHGAGCSALLCFALPYST